VQHPLSKGVFPQNANAALCFENASRQVRSQVATKRFGLGVQSWFLSAAPAASPKIQNPWGGKSMGWEILGKFENPLTNPGFSETRISAKSQGLKICWLFFTKFFKILEICIMFGH